jgi:hypothetical protein
MDKNVLAAMARWPDVPDVFGWLSLSPQGQWRLHPRGDAALSGPGEPINSERILQFIDRNYACDRQGRWYFQNGPQRVFVRLDAAPYILRTTGSRRPLCMQTHNSLNVRAISGWWLDESGRLYAQTEHGPGLVAGRDLMQVLESLHTPCDEPLTAVLENSPKAEHAVPIKAEHAGVIYLNFCTDAAVSRELGFIGNPVAA